MEKKLLVPVVLSALLVIAGCGKTQYGIVTAREGLVLREHPAVDAARLDVMSVGTKVTVVSVDGPRQSLHKLTSNWYNVTVNNLNGWAFGGFIKLLRGELSNAYLAREEGFIELYQYKNGEFDMSVNLCQAVGMIYGKYSSENNYIKCKVREVDFSGFLGDDISEFEYKVVDKNSIMYKGRGIGCGPMDGMILYKFDR